MQHHMRMRVLLPMYKYERVYITHTHTHWVQVQKYTARRLFSFYVQMSRLESNQREHHRDKELVSQLCVTFYWNRKSKEVNGTKKKKKESRETRAWGLVVKQWAVTWRQRWSSPGHGCPPCQSHGRWRREGSGWSAFLAEGREGERERQGRGRNVKIKAKISRMDVELSETDK